MFTLIFWSIDYRYSRQSINVNNWLQISAKAITAWFTADNCGLHALEGARALRIYIYYISFDSKTTWVILHSVGQSNTYTNILNGYMVIIEKWIALVRFIATSNPRIITVVYPTCFVLFSIFRHKEYSQQIRERGRSYGVPCTSQNRFGCVDSFSMLKVFMTIELIGSTGTPTGTWYPGTSRESAR